MPHWSYVPRSQRPIRAPESSEVEKPEVVDTREDHELRRGSAVVLQRGREGLRLRQRDHRVGVAVQEQHGKSSGEVPGGGIGQGVAGLPQRGVVPRAAPKKAVIMSVKSVVS